MSIIKSTLCLVAILAAYGIVGHLDYEDAVMLEEIERHPAAVVTDECSGTDDLAARVRHRAVLPHESVQRLSLDPATPSGASLFARPCVVIKP